MYSHKRSFTGQSSRSLAALIDPPFLIFGLVAAAIFSVAHSAVTYLKVHHHVRSLPVPLENFDLSAMRNILQTNASVLDFQIILSTWIGLIIPLIVFATAIRWTLASLRVSVQRLVTIGTLSTFYFCSFMTIALANTDWTPGNRLLSIFSPFGTNFFQSVRALLCLAVAIGCLVTLTKNATSKFNRNMRWFAALVILLSTITVDYFHSQRRRGIHSSYMRAPASVQFIFVIPGLRPVDLQKSLRTEQLNELRNQLSSFQEVHPGTPSLLGQFVTSMLGLEANTHGIRHDFTDPRILSQTWNSIVEKSFPKGHQVYATSIGGPSPLDSLVGGETDGKRCGQTPKQLAKLGHFQASVIPYALTPKIVESVLIPEVDCTNRFLTLQQHLAQVQERMTDTLRSQGLRTFLVWLAPTLRNHHSNEASGPADYESWEQQTKNIYEILRSHKQFLNTTGLTAFHQTFFVGLSTPESGTAAFVRFDGQTKSQLTDLTLDSPGQLGQISVADLLRTQSTAEMSDSPFFYSEFTDTQTPENISSLAPELKYNGANPKIQARFLINSDLLRKAIVNSKRHVICQNVASPTGHRLLVKVSLNLRATENRLPELTYEDFQFENLPSPENQLKLDDCLKNAREILTASVAKDVSLRDSSAFKTLLTGLPVKSVRMLTEPLETSSESEDEAFDRDTSAVPTMPDEEQEE
ncbi:MAG: hypothetical protein RLZZ488_2117 [Pseudomonadota bacterium]|jgi:hypothetical protein